MTIDSPTHTAVLLVRLGERQYGLPLAIVERVLPMAAVLQLPDSGEGLLGVLNLHGEILPVMDPHQRLGLARPVLAAEQRLVLLRSYTRFLLWVDEVEEVVDVTSEALSEVPVQHTSPTITRVLRLGESIVPVLAATALEPRGSRP
ncbi:MAG: chemotaxis protein CheW [Chloroflexi bacterium]|nr:MAG: chemotaxis protein CheW [Chloroflexota bacterium]